MSTNFKIYFLTVFIFTFLNSRSYSQIIISLPQYTIFGGWGEWEYCPSNEFVNAFQLKVEPQQGEFIDDTALNGIKFYCGKIGEEFNSSNSITSKVGHWGNWGHIFKCLDLSIATGLQLRSERRQGIFDDTAANNLKMYCLDGIRHEGDGTLWGRWSPLMTCPKKTAICGFRTQVETPTSNDDTALNNVDFACCDVEAPSETCEPTERWEFIQVCDNSYSDKPKKCDITGEKQGINYWQEETKLSVVYSKLGFTIEDQYISLIRNIQKKLKKSPKSGFDYRKFGGNLMERKQEIHLKADPHEKLYLYRLLVKCGIYNLNTEYYKTFNKEPSYNETHFDY